MITLTSLTHPTVEANLYAAMRTAINWSRRKGLGYGHVYNKEGQRYITVKHCRKEGLSFYHKGQDITPMVKESFKRAKINTVRAAMVACNGHFFTVTFVKKDGTERTLNGRLGVTAKLVGGKNTTAHISKYQTVYEGAKQSYKNVNLETVTKFSGGGKTLTFKEA